VANTPQSPQTASQPSNQATTPAPNVPQQEGRERARVTAFLGESIVIALGAMALIQVFRRLFPIRGWFHQNAVLHWLGGDGDADTALAELKRRAQGRSLAMFDLPIELLCAQLSAIGEQLLDELTALPQPPIAPPPPREYAATLLDRMSSGEWKKNPIPSPATAASAAPFEESVAATRTRIAYAVQRRLDQLQIDASARWRRWLLVTAIVLSFVLFFIAAGVLGAGQRFITPISPTPSGYAVSYFIGAILVALFAGYMASIARDLVAIIEKLRR
jgi:hypothetical protein